MLSHTLPRQELYTYRVEWSEDDQEFVGTVAEFPSLSYLAPTSTEAFAGIREVVADTLEILEEDGREAPEPFSLRPSQDDSTCVFHRNCIVVWFSRQRFLTRA